MQTVFVIFGVTGDLMQSKILPGIFNLYRKKKLPEKFKIIGFSRRNFTDEDLRDYIQDLMIYKGFNYPEHWKKFLNNFSYVKGNFDNIEGYKTLYEKIDEIKNEWGTDPNKLIYLAVPPEHYRPIINNLLASKLSNINEGRTRIVLEKPFGRDLKHAIELDKLLGKSFKEEQIYRVDHFLGKETVRNILIFRFSNLFLAPSWNNKYIEKIEIKLAEKEQVIGRSDYYDVVGALRDVGQNHLLQLLALFTMGRPDDFTAENIWEKRSAVLSAMKIYRPDEVERYTVRGQYVGYRNERGIAENSNTETYFRIKTFINNSRWFGVPMYLESGKALDESKLEAIVTFKHQDPCLCPSDDQHYSNVLRYQIQPKEQITTSFLVKKPGFGNVLQQKKFQFDYKQAFGEEEFIEAYEKLLLDMITGDQTLFVTTDEILNQWRFVEPISKSWQADKPSLFFYQPHQKVNIEVIADNKQTMQKEVGLIGLGKMGSNLAKQLLGKKWRVVGFNRSIAKTENLKPFGIEVAGSIEELVKNLPKPRVIILMLPAGKTVDEIIFGKAGLLKYLDKGDFILESGNSYYKDTVLREKKCQARGIRFVDVGISGGPKGAGNGACLMIGGKSQDFMQLIPLFVEISIPGGVKFFEGAGAGHFVKMVHNGIEYGMMQAIAEGFTLLKNSKYKLDLHRVAEVYNRGSVIESRLVNWLKEALSLYGNDLQKVSGVVSHSGEGEWTVNTAREMNLKVKVIEEALNFRINSLKNPSFTGRLVSAMRGMFGGHFVYETKESKD